MNFEFGTEACTKQVLDHGSVTLLNVASHNPKGASDRDPASAARMSFGQKELDRTKSQDLRLSNYLYTHQHMTPFEMTVVWLEMKLPIFVARQFVRHRTMSFNEISGRYVKLPHSYYIPNKIGAKPTNGAKQGQEDTLSPSLAHQFQVDLENQCESSYKKYSDYLEQGVAAEHARLFLHLNHYTHWLMKVDIRNLLHFLKLRLDNHAQIEARMYAQAVYDLLLEVLPHTMQYIETDSLTV